MFDIRLRLFTADGVKGAVLRTSSVTSSIQESGVAGLTFAVSERVAGKLVAPFVVGVEFSTGGAYVQPRNGLFIVTEEGGDSADASKTFTFTGTAFVPWLLDGMHQRMVAYAGSRRVGNKHEWPDANPGTIIRTLIDSGKTGGWAPMVACDFSGAVDSAGVAWTAAERWSPEFQDLVSIREIFDAHVNAGLIDWWSEGTTLRAFRPGAGVAYPNVKLGGPGFARMPVKRQYEGQFNFLTVIAEDGARYYENPGADETYGTRHMTATLSGVKLADADRIVQPMLLEGRTPRRELSYEWVPDGKLPVPWVDFQVGDAVQVRDRSGWVEQRVLGITVQKADGKVTVRATVGSKLLNRLKRAVQTIEGGSLGNLQGGTGVTVPVAPPAPVSAPKTPTGLHVVSNTATWGEDGTARTRIVLGWDAVTQAEDLSDVDGVTYEVAGRLASDAPARLTATDALTFSVEGWEPDIARYVKVRALDRLGNASAWSGEISVTPVMPSSIVPKAPTGLAVSFATAAFNPDGTVYSIAALTWVAVTQSVDGAPVDVVEYEVTSFGYAPWRTASTGQAVVWATGAFPVQVRALTSLGVWSDPASFTIPAQTPAALTVAPSDPVLTPGMGGVAYRWDGLSSTGGVMPAGFSRVVVDSGPSATGPWTALGATLSAAGGGSVAGAVGESVFVRFRAFDTLGRAAGTSVVVSAVAAGVALSDIPGLEDDLDGIRFTADGKNRIHVSVDEPESNLAVVKTNYAQSPYGTVVPPKYGGATASTVVTQALAGNPTPNGVTTGLRIDIPAGGPTQGGVLFSLPVDAPGQYVVSCWVNRQSGPATQMGLAQSGIASQATRTFAFNVWTKVEWTVTVAAEYVGTVYSRFGFRQSGVIDPAGSIFYVSEFQAAPLGQETDPPIEGGLPGEGTTAYRWRGTPNISPSEEVVSDLAQGDLWLQLDPTGASVIAVKVWNGTSWGPQVLYADSIIAAESITAPLIKAGEIQVNHVSPSFGDDLNLSANESVTIIVGTQANQASQIADLDAGVSDARSAADAASGAAGTAQATANDAATQAADAAASASDVGQRLDTHQTYYRFGVDGLAIGDPNSASELRLKPDRIEMTQNSVVVSYWEGGVFVADEARLDSAQIGNHQFMAYGAGRTIVRPL